MTKEKLYSLRRNLIGALKEVEREIECIELKELADKFKSRVPVVKVFLTSKVR